MSLRIVAALDPEGVALDDGLGPDGLARGDVVLHDGPEDLEAAFSDHRRLPSCRTGTRTCRVLILRLTGALGTVRCASSALP